jgi:hypothetical protein
LLMALMITPLSNNPLRRHVSTWISRRDAHLFD